MRAGERRAAAAGPFTGKSVVITGTIEGWPRDAMKRMLVRQGARVSDAVSKKTDILICGADPGTKRDKARALGVRVIEAEEFVKLVGGAP